MADRLQPPRGVAPCALTIALAVVGAVTLCSCVPRERPEEVIVAPAPTPALSEEEIRPLERPNIAIVDVNEHISADGHTTTVSGTLVNRGAGPTNAVSVHVEALDRDGAVVVSTDSEPSTELIAPGATASFSASFENRPGIDRYHVEAISR